MIGNVIGFCMGCRRGEGHMGIETIIRDDSEGKTWCACDVRHDHNILNGGSPFPEKWRLDPGHKVTYAHLQVRHVK